MAEHRRGLPLLVSSSHQNVVLAPDLKRFPKETRSFEPKLKRFGLSSV